MSKTEMVLDTKGCAEVALYMYREWQKAMEPPLFIYKQFPDWLEGLLATPQPNATNEGGAVKPHK